MGLAHPKYAAEPEIIAARKQLAIQSREALMVEWLPKHHVHENLNPDTGLGDDVGNSNPMYHWGALLSFIGQCWPPSDPASPGLPVVLIACGAQLLLLGASYIGTDGHPTLTCCRDCRERPLLPGWQMIATPLCSTQCSTLCQKKTV
jgi:hypothetical protein